MSLLYICTSFGINRREFRFPLLFNRLHLALTFCQRRTIIRNKRTGSDNSVLLTFLMIVTVFTSKCTSSTFPNRGERESLRGNEHALGLHPSPSTTIRPILLRDSESYQPDASNNFIIYNKVKTLAQYNDTEDSISVGGSMSSSREGGQYKRTLGYFLKGLILPMLISLTLSLGFVVYKNRVKRARLEAFQNSAQEARRNPSYIGSHQSYFSPATSDGGRNSSNFMTNAFLSAVDLQGEWSLIRNTGNIFEGDDYTGEGGETARHMPFHFDKPPEYSAVFDLPSYQEAMSLSGVNNNFARQSTFLTTEEKNEENQLNGPDRIAIEDNYDEEYTDLHLDEGKRLMMDAEANDG